LGRGRLAGRGQLARLARAERGDGEEAGCEEPVVEVPRRTETGEAPGRPGATTENIGNM
jgi:hypothetical protein